MAISPQDLNNTYLCTSSWHPLGGGVGHWACVSLSRTSSGPAGLSERRWRNWTGNKMWVILEGHYKLHVNSVILKAFQTYSCWGGPHCSHFHSLPSHSACRCGRCVQQEHPDHWHTDVAGAPGPGLLLTGTPGQTKRFDLENLENMLTSLTVCDQKSNVCF